MRGEGPLSAIAAVPQIAKVTLRQLLGRRRTLVLVLLAILPVLLALVFRAAARGNADGATEIERFTRRIFDTVSMTILLPLVAILFGSGAFGAEIDDGTVVYLLAKPVPRWIVVAAKAFSAVAIADPPHSCLNGPGRHDRHGPGRQRRRERHAGTGSWRWLSDPLAMSRCSSP
jgi:hypothetical protein